MLLGGMGSLHFKELQIQTQENSKDLKQRISYFISVGET